MGKEFGAGVFVRNASVHAIVNGVLTKHRLVNRPWRVGDGGLLSEVGAGVGIEAEERFLRGDGVMNRAHTGKMEGVAYNYISRKSPGMGSQGLRFLFCSTTQVGASVLTCSLFHLSGRAVLWLVIK